MSTRGRKAEFRVIEGGRTDMPDDADVPVYIPPEMHAEWLSVVDDLRDRQVYSEAMTGTIDTYVMALHNMRKAQEALDRYGPLIDGGKGILKQNPAATMVGKSQATVLRLSAELGLTPAARSRKHMTGDDGYSDRVPDLFDV